MVLPDSQKSWISKAIFISDKIKETYYDHKSNTIRAQKQSPDDWYLLDGTPATCAAIGIHHICDQKPDLLISGPNYGRNSSSIAALSSGTIAATLEGAGAGVKGIAVSYAFWNKECKEEWVQAATRITVKLAQHLYDHWDPDVDLYTINIPLCQELVEGKCQVLKTTIHQAQHSCLFQPTNARTMDERELRSAQSKGESTRVEAGSESGPKTYEFRPRFEDLSQTIDSEEGRLSDTWAIAQKHISVSPLKANFQHVAFNPRDREIKL